MALPTPSSSRTARTADAFTRRKPSSSSRPAVRFRYTGRSDHHEKFGRPTGRRPGGPAQAPCSLVQLLSPVRRQAFGRAGGGLGERVVRGAGQVGAAFVHHFLGVVPEPVFARFEAADDAVA